MPSINLLYSICFQSLDSPLQISRQRPAPTSTQHNWKDKWFVEFNLCEKKIDGFFHSIASLIMVECACASLIFTSFFDVQSLVCVDPTYLNWSISSSVSPFIHMLVDGHRLMLLTRILLLSELISMPYPATVQSFTELLECFFTAS